MSAPLPPEPLPPWVARNEREREQMVKWVNKMLDEGGGRRGLSPAHAARLTPESLAAGIKQLQKWQREGGPERELARHGNIGPLPEFVRKTSGADNAEYVQLLPLAPGQKRPPYTIDGEIIHRPGVPFKDLLKEAERKKRIDAAVADVTRIKRIWKDHYGRTNRGERQVSAIDIAAERHSHDQFVKYPDESGQLVNQLLIAGVTADEVIERIKRTARKR
jgi:hypothetical protein